MDHSEHSQHAPAPFWRSPTGLALVVALAVGGFYLVTEHTAHLFGALPYLLILSCPLMHLFMHKGHGHGAGRPSSEKRRSEDEQPWQ